MSKTIGILHPGAMGVSVAASAKNSGNRVYWASEGRSEATRQRADEVGLVDAGSLADMCEKCEVILSVCPPAYAEQVAQDVIAAGFSGLYLDANAIAPQRTLRIGQAMADAGVTFVDGGIIGGPAWESGRTWLYLSGEAAPEIAECFSAGPLETSIVSNQIGQASALKMVFAAYTKGTTALLAAIIATAESLGVREALNAQWSRNGSVFADETEARVRNVTAKAWRFEGEMQEIAATFAEAGLPDGFHLAAADVYSRIADFKDATETPELADVLKVLLQ
ncbi:MAG: NAD(P)-dependent oxidoreductase [Anaerolineae bacterium]|nr:NAD(P)-dependent oxidoreductase [Anaerolineae bacterium]